jgi:protoporphyrinogen oxidase
MFDAFFRPYTEKVWGVPCDQISADWAEARIGLPSLWQVLRQSIFPPRQPPATAVSRFYYPRTGFGYISERIAEEIRRSGGSIRTGTAVREIRPTGNGFTIRVQDAADRPQTLEAAHVISTIPLSVLLQALPKETGSRKLLAANQLHYRHLICVFLVIDLPKVSPDSWTYFPDRDFIIGRTHEPKNWSRQMVPEPEMTSICAEIYTGPGESHWQMSDEVLVQRTMADLAKIGWVRPQQVKKSAVVRVPFAYPVYDLDYSGKLERTRAFLSKWERLHLVGRTGSFKYLNSDGVIEEIFGFISRLFPADPAGVKPLEEERGRWA